MKHDITQSIHVAWEHMWGAGALNSTSVAYLYRDSHTAPAPLETYQTEGLDQAFINHIVEKNAAIYQLIEISARLTKTVSRLK